LCIVDDGYPDDSLPDYFAELTRADPRVEYHRNEQNLGANANYRECVSMVQNEIAVIMGADDLMLPNYLTTVRAAFEAPDVAIVQPQIEVIDENGTVYLPLADRIKSIMRKQAVGASSDAVFRGEAIAKSLIEGNWLYFPSIAWRADMLKRHPFRPEYDVVQDLALTLDILLDGGALLVSGTTTFQYRRHRGSDSTVRALDGRRFIEEKRFFTDYGRRFVEANWSGAARAAKVHVSSRLNAVWLLPQVVAKQQWRGLRRLVSHAVKR
jgi:glycosyltransferase involved in cell wall biosynthesis